MAKQKSYCVMGTSVRSGRRVELTKQNAHITKEEAEKAKVVLEDFFRSVPKEKKQLSFKNLRVALRK